MAPGNNDTLEQLRDPTKRPPLLTEPLPPEVTNYGMATDVKLDGRLFITNLRSARKGGAPGPSGARNEHYKPMLEFPEATEDLTCIAAHLAQAKVPANIARAICL